MIATQHFLSALVLAGCGAAASGPAPLARYARASGSWDAVAALETRSALAIGGLTGESTSLDDVRTGRFVTHTVLGPLDQRDGFDGAARWTQTIGGEVVVLDDPAALRQAATDRWLTTRGYTRPGAAYRALPATTDGARTFHVVEATPAGGAPIALWLDDATGLLARTVHHEGTRTVTTTFSDYRAVDGVLIAFHQVVDSGDPRDQQVIDVREAHVRPAPAATAFARPTTDDRLSFASGTTTEVPFDLLNNHIYVNAQVDGQPVRVMVDTGGLNVLTPAAVQRLGLTGSGKMAISGAGERQVDVGFAKAKQLTVGGLALRAPVFYVVDFEQLGDVEGEPLDGLVGFEMFQRTAVRIDYARHVLTVQARAGFTPPAGATAVPFELRERTPIVAGAIDGLPARFSIDTGARNALTINSPFARAHDLAGKYHPKFETVTGWGVGGASRARPVRVQEVKLGDVRVANVVGELYSGDKGSFADPELSGNIGGAVLRRFVVTFDYRDKKLYLAPAAQPPPDIFDRAGMFFLRDGDAIKLVAIVPGGPAAKAGLAAGDRVVAIDGEPIAARRLAAWRAVLQAGEVGARHTLRLAGGADRTLVLAELLP